MERIQGKAIDLWTKNNKYLVVFPPCPLSPARESAEEDAQRRGCEAVVVCTVSRGHAVSGRPSPGHTRETTDGLVSKLIERSGAEIQISLLAARASVDYGDIHALPLI